MEEKTAPERKATQLFGRRSGREKRRCKRSREADLYEQIGRLKMELEWLKKKASLFS